MLAIEVNVTCFFTQLFQIVVQLPELCYSATQSGQLCGDEPKWSMGMSIGIRFEN